VHHYQLHLEQLKLEARRSNIKNCGVDDTNVSFFTEAITTPRTPETHAYCIPQVDITNMQICKSVVATDNTSAKNDILIATEKGSISVIDKKCDSTNFSSSSDSRKISLDARDKVYPDSEWKIENCNQQQVMIGNHEATVQDLSNVGHVYEEVRAIKQPCNSLYEYDIQDYYEKYSPTTAKTLIDTLFLPRHTICRKCARTKGSPVYTDRLIYTKESLLAIEVILCQYDDVSCFKYPREDSEDIFCSRYDQNRDYMLVYNYTKTNVAGIFYSHCWPRDIFDLQSLLKPSINVVNRTCCNLVVNTQLYHRCIINYHVRTSRAGCTPMTFYRDYGTLISSTKQISHNDSQDPLVYQVYRSKDDHTNEHRRNRSSLLLLEPLLLMPESTDSEHRENTKNKISQSERTKIIKIIMIYALSFLILTSITFYIVYLT
ncbi:PREDICTED: uncharacterized protein LOC108781812, partial [Cyphomyrmex costatus]|uniref:uncharacterized protein LOC108781812 n=1 Tax=Cyphomyrmex costatus TaxID=456900 RepID=UPI00085223A3